MLILAQPDQLLRNLLQPPRMREGSIAVLPCVEAHCTESTVNQKLSVLSASRTPSIPRTRRTIINAIV